jgi:hypothetical protein
VSRDTPSEVSRSGAVSSAWLVMLLCAYRRSQVIDHRRSLTPQTPQKSCSGRSGRISPRKRPWVPKSTRSYSPRSVLAAATWRSSSRARDGRFTSKRRCQCGCRTLADFSVLTRYQGRGKPVARTLHRRSAHQQIFCVRPSVVLSMVFFRVRRDSPAREPQSLAS